MPDFVLMAQSLILAAIVPGLTLFVIARPGEDRPRWQWIVGWISALGIGIFAGCSLLGEWPRWPPLEDRDRFLVILLPLALAIEATAMSMPSRRSLAWLLRISLAASSAPILLYNSSYLANLHGPHSAEWTLVEAVLVMGLSALILTGVWGLLARLAARTSGQVLAPVLVLVTLASGATVMLSGYYRGGLLALPVAGAIAGTTMASRLLPKQSIENLCLGIGVLGIFALLFIGRFFGSLPTGLAIPVLLSPLLVWIPEAPGIRKLSLAMRAAIGVAAVLVALGIIVTCAQVRFHAAAQSKSGASR